MNETDNFVLVTFNGLAKMTKENKEIILGNINNLYTSGNTDILLGLKFELSLLNQNYSSGDRVASMILLSDGEEYCNPYGMVDDLFKELLETENKTDYVFTLNSFGFGNYHDYILMNDFALIKPGAYYFYIEILKQVEEAYGTIYGIL